MAEKEEKTQLEQQNKLHAVAQPDQMSPSRRRLWSNPWFIFGSIVLVLSVIFTLMNNTDLTINLIGASMIIKLPLLILGSALLGAAIEFFIVLGPRLDARDEIHRLKRKIRELER